MLFFIYAIIGMQVREKESWSILFDARGHLEHALNLSLLLSAEKVFGGMAFNPDTEYNRHNHFQSFIPGLLVLFRWVFCTPPLMWHEKLSSVTKFPKKNYVLTPKQLIEMVSVGEQGKCFLELVFLDLCLIYPQQELPQLRKYQKNVVTSFMVNFSLI